MLDYVRSQFVVAEETIRRDMTLIAKEAERKVTLLRKSHEEKEVRVYMFVSIVNLVETSFTA